MSVWKPENTCPGLSLRGFAIANGAGWTFKSVPQRRKDMIITYKTVEQALQSVKQYGMMLEYVPEDLKTEELFSKEIDPLNSVKNSQKAALENVGMAVNRILTKFISDEIHKLDDDDGEKGIYV
jgi:hypothetical protein